MLSFLWDFSFGNFYVSRAQVLANIGSVLEAILKYCDDNIGSLTQEEQSSFMNEHSSLSGVRSNKDTTHSTLKKTLDECEELKLRIQTVCRRHKEDSIRRGPVPPAATTIGRCYLLLLSLKTESADTDSTLAPSTELVDPNPIITSVDPHAQLLADIDSALKDFLNDYINNLDSLPKEQQFSFEIEYSKLSGVRSNKDATYSTLLKVLNVFKELKLRTQTDCRKQVDCIRRTLTPMDYDSSYETLPESPISIQSDIALTNGSQLGPSCPSTDTSSSTVSSSDSEAHETSSITSPASTEGNSRAPPTVTDCMIFDGASSADSPTFNIASKGATEDFFTMAAVYLSDFQDSRPQAFASRRQVST